MDESLILDAGCSDSWSEWDHMFTLRSWKVVYMLLRPDRDGQSYPCPRVKLSTQALAEHTPSFRLIYLPLQCPCAASFVAGYLDRPESLQQQFYALSRQPDLRRLPSLVTIPLYLIPSAEEEEEEEAADPRPAPAAPPAAPPVLGQMLQTVLADPEMLTALHRLIGSSCSSSNLSAAAARK